MQKGKIVEKFKHRMAGKRTCIVQCIPCIALGIFFLLSGMTTTDAQPEMENTDPVFAYEVTPDDAEWRMLGSVQSKIEACRIPKEILEDLTEEQLLRAVLDFPFVYDVFHYSSREVGVRSLVSISDAYAELLRRADAKSTVWNALCDMTQKKETLTVEEELEYEILDTLYTYHEEAVGELN